MNNHEIVTNILFLYKADLPRIIQRTSNRGRPGNKYNNILPDTKIIGNIVNRNDVTGAYIIKPPGNLTLAPLSIVINISNIRRIRSLLNISTIILDKQDNGL